MVNLAKVSLRKKGERERMRAERKKMGENRWRKSAVNGKEDLVRRTQREREGALPKFPSSQGQGTSIKGTFASANILLVPGAH